MEVGLIHYLVLSALLASAGAAVMLTKRNAIGVLIGVELILNAAGVNFVAYNALAHDTHVDQQVMLTAQQVERYDLLMATPDADLDDTAALLRVIQRDHPDALAIIQPPADIEPGAAVSAAFPAVDGMIFAVFIIVLAAAEAAVALAIVLNYYNTLGTIDIDHARLLKG